MIDIPLTRGKHTRQAHVDVPEGTHEEEYARNGFFGKYAHLYRAASPVSWNSIEGPLRPRAYEPVQKLEDRPGSAPDFFQRRRVLLQNSDVRIWMERIEHACAVLSRNADGDELFFVHHGVGSLETDFGVLNYAPGDYLYVPRGTMFRFVPRETTIALGVESLSEFSFPDRGMLGQHALFDPAMLQAPELAPLAPLAPRAQGYELQIKRADTLSRVFYPENPLKTLGWKGTLFPWRLNVQDIRPISCDRYHLPPSAHSTLVARNFVVCTFLPRPLENGDPRAMKVPFFHSNIDFDEVLFYHRGDFFSRTGISEGMLTFHPQGIAHGPQPGAVERTAKLSRTEEVAVMIDTKNPLFPTKWAEECEQVNYWRSWGAQGEEHR